MSQVFLLSSVLTLAWRYLMTLTIMSGSVCPTLTRMQHVACVETSTIALGMTFKIAKASLWALMWFLASIRGWWAWLWGQMRRSGLCCLHWGSDSFIQQYWYPPEQFWTFCCMPSTTSTTDLCAKLCVWSVCRRRVPANSVPSPKCVCKSVSTEWYTAAKLEETRLLWCVCQLINIISKYPLGKMSMMSISTLLFCSEIPCPANTHFESQGTGPATCVSPNSTLSCPLPFQESCICKSGYILSAWVCVPHVWLQLWGSLLLLWRNCDTRRGQWKTLYFILG